MSTTIRQPRAGAPAGATKRTLPSGGRRPTVSPGGGAADGGGDPAPAPARKGGRTGLIVVLVVALIAAVAAMWWFLLGPGASTEPSEPAPPVPGAIVQIDPISVNLADGHYLRVGVALQLIADAPTPEVAPALDTLISLFSGQKMEELADATQRNALKQQLSTQLAELYGADVMDVYFTDFVTQ